MKIRIFKKYFLVKYKQLTYIFIVFLYITLYINSHSLITRFQNRDFFAGANFGNSITNLPDLVQNGYENGLNDGYENNETTIMSLLSVSVLIGSMIGSMAVSYFNNKFGYKKVAIVASISAAIINLLTMIKVHWVYLFVMRILLGIPSSALTTTVPSWLGEIATIKQRGILLILWQLFICFGIIVSSLVLLIIQDYLNRYWISFLFSTVFCTGSAIACFFLPYHKNPEEYNQQQTDEYENIPDNAIQEQNLPQEKDCSWKEVFNKKYIKELLVAFLAGVQQQATGINSIIIYATITFSDIFSDNKTSQTMSSIYGSLLVSCVNFCSTLVALPLVDRIGRRKLLFSGTGLCLIALILYIIAYSLDYSNPNTALIISASIVFLFGFEIGPGPVFYVIISETLQGPPKYKLTSIGFTMNWVTNIIVVLIYPFFTGSSIKYAYVLYLILTIIPTVILFFIIPETKGKSYQEIQNIMIKQ